MRGPAAQFTRAAAVTVALAAVGVAAAHASAYRPELAFQLGRTFAVGSRTSDAYDQGGFSLSVGALWPWESRFRFGAVLFASDFGSEVLPVSLSDPSGGPSKYYGSIDFGHRGAWGAAWRVDALGPRVGRLGRGYATASYGYFRYRQDRVGRPLDELSAVGGTLGVGLERPLGAHHALGVTTSSTWMSEEFTRRYGSASLEWRWRW
jgi:hypothetical protein